MRRLPGVEDAAWALGGSLGVREHVLAVPRAQWPVRRVDVASMCATWLGWVTEVLLGRSPPVGYGGGPRAGLAPQVDLVATEIRVLVLDPRWNGFAPATCVAEIPRSDIVTVSLPFVGDSRWRTLRIDRTSGWSMQLQIDRHAARGFVAALA